MIQSNDIVDISPYVNPLTTLTAFVELAVQFEIEKLNG